MGQLLTIGFGSHQVSIKADCPEIIQQIELWFQAMLVPQAAPASPRLLVSGDFGKYRLQNSSGLDRSFTSTLWLLQAIKYEVVTSLIEANSHLLWFHAGAIAQGHKGLLIASPSGGGKSTLTSRLCQQGWRYLSDDAVPLDLHTGKLFPFPQTPRVRQPSKTLVSSNKLASLPKSEVVLTGDRLCTRPVSLSGIVFPRFSPDEPARLSLMSSSQALLSLLKNCINFTHHKKKAIEALCQLIQPCPAAALHFSDAETAIAHLISWWEG
ncbi:MAG: hypothetical protein F6J95_025750 [Leptolyngbya sp. SIO1E4]|nr:hypothetical protein [Leptolyngbya sp. SIO1E4]